MRLLSTGIALALMLIPVSMDAKAKKKKLNRDYPLWKLWRK